MIVAIMKIEVSKSNKNPKVRFSTQYVKTAFAFLSIEFSNSV